MKCGRRSFDDFAFIDYFELRLASGRDRGVVVGGGSRCVGALGRVAFVRRLLLCGLRSEGGRKAASLQTFECLARACNKQPLARSPCSWELWPPNSRQSLQSEFALEPKITDSAFRELADASSRLTVGTGGFAASPSAFTISRYRGCSC